ncbi:MAG TPA: ABC transporter substrate-binding protein [Stellaceae bacterium]|nr:ABC transporter substrate-binding protein [Stellaceae bacterium]
MRFTWGLAAALAGLVLMQAPAANAQYSDNKIKLGILDDFSGPYCLDNCMGPVVATQMAVDEFGGKINGVPIEVIHGDHQDKPDVGVRIAERWYDTEQVDAILDVVYSGVALAVQEVARQRGKAVLYSEAGSDALTGKQCAPYSAQWTYDTYQLPNLGEAVPKLGKTWFILSADYAYGKALVEGVTRSVTAAGGKVVGTVFHPFGASDMSSFMLQAQASKAEVIALGDAGPDMTNAIKSANEFGLIKSGVKVVPLSMDLQAIEGAGGLPATQGMIMSLPWYRDANPPKSEAFADEYEKRQGKMAPYLMAGLYSAVRTYLTAAQATGSDDPKKIFPWMQQHPVDDAFTKHGVLRPDGRMVHDVYLVQVKTPEESKGPRDLAKLLGEIPGDKAFRPMDQGGCPLVAANGGK